MENIVTFRYVVALAILTIFAESGYGSEALIINSSSLAQPCSRVCESKYCTFPPLLRYGKYCGIGYTGCPGEEACDGIDVCCKKHDACIGDDFSNYLNKTCNQGLLTCVSNFQSSRAPQFPKATCGVDTISTTIKLVMEIATHLDDQH